MKTAYSQKFEKITNYKNLLNILYTAKAVLVNFHCAKRDGVNRSQTLYTPWSRLLSLLTPSYMENIKTYKSIIYITCS